MNPQSKTKLEASGSHLSFLDFLRGVAILWVFAYHALVAGYGTDSLGWGGWLRNFHASPSFLLLFPAMLGFGGVAIFFVVSGFCIHLSYERSESRLFRTFYLRRFFRIYPPYLAALIVFACLFAPTRLKFDSFHDFAQIGDHLLLIHNYIQASSYAINGPFWSIAVEVQLYLLYPVLLWLVRSFGWKPTLWSIGAIELAVRAIRGWRYNADLSTPVWLTLSPIGFWFSWSIGAFSADKFIKGEPLFLSNCRLWAWPLVTLLCYLIKPLSNFCFVPLALTTANLIARWVSAGAREKQGESLLRSYLLKGVTFVGVISYSVYLIHDPLLGLVPEFCLTKIPAAHGHGFILFMCCLLELPLVLLVSLGFYLLVERPSIRIGKWFVRNNLFVKVPVQPALVASASEAGHGSGGGK